MLTVSEWRLVGTSQTSKMVKCRTDSHCSYDDECFVWRSVVDCSRCNPSSSSCDVLAVRSNGQPIDVLHVSLLRPCVRRAHLFFVNRHIAPWECGKWSTNCTTESRYKKEARCRVWLSRQLFSYLSCNVATFGLHASRRCLLYSASVALIRNVDSPRRAELLGSEDGFARVLWRVRVVASVG